MSMSLAPLTPHLNPSLRRLAARPSTGLLARCLTPGLRLAALLTVGLGALLPVAAQEGAGLQAQRAPAALPGTEQRLSLGIADLRLELQAAHVGHGQARGRAFGDYYLTGPGFGDGEVSGGLRVTSGVAFGPHAAALPTARPSGLLGHGATAAWSSRASGGLAFGAQLPEREAGMRQALPYIGLGYTSLSVRQRWSLTADIGLGGLRDGEQVRFGSSSANAQQAEKILNELRLAPVLQLGVSYAF